MENLRNEDSQQMYCAVRDAYLGTQVWGGLRAKDHRNALECREDGGGVVGKGMCNL